jgi:hypothetical protein
MKLSTKLYAALLAGALMLLSACGAAPEPMEESATEVVLKGTVTEADPKAAVKEIYAMPELADAVTYSLSSAALTKSFPELDAESLVSYAGKLSSPDGGLADVVFFEPAEGERAAAREALQKYQEARIREFENYDILGAFKIAQDAIVIDQGDYVILLMLAEDLVKPAREIIDNYIPL